ncbi:MAG: 2-oxo acid dehydrogenase subunit E2, partial [Actinomycetota bacterium]|nr:2-oxo acid dehydrogenase subunit E2 [Actinomycetota bacterium]
QMGVSVAEGTVVEWKKQVGDWVQADEIIASISTDKIDTDVESPATGRLQEVLVEVGTTVEVGTVLARIATDAKPGEAHVSEGRSSSGGTSEAAAALEAPGEAGELKGDTTVRTTRKDGGRKYSPVVMRIASEHGIDLDQVEGTGRGGRVRKQDVLAYVEAGVEEAPLHIESPYRADAPATPYRPPEPQILPRMRRSIGEHMKRSLETAATCTTWVEVDFSRVERARRDLGITALPLVARCAIGALREFGALNAWLEGERLTVHTEINLGIAVSLAEEGLIVPVIRGAQDLSAEGLGKLIRDLARRARAKQLTPDDVQGGTFTITNPGQYGSLMATPVINQPQVAILDLEAIVKRPVVVSDEHGFDSIAIRPMCILGLSWDHRALDGAIAAQFLASLKRRIEGWEGG